MVKKLRLRTSFKERFGAAVQNLQTIHVSEKEQESMNRMKSKLESMTTALRKC